MANPFIVKEALLDHSKHKPMHVEYKKKRRVNTRLVRASWRRVLISSFAYALGLNICRFAYYEVFGKPTFFEEGVRAMERLPGSGAADPSIVDPGEESELPLISDPNSLNTNEAPRSPYVDE